MYKAFFILSVLLLSCGSIAFACEFMAIMALNNTTLAPTEQLDTQNLFYYYKQLGFLGTTYQDNNGFGVAFYLNNSTITSPGLIDDGGDYIENDRRSATYRKGATQNETYYQVTPTSIVILGQEFNYSEIRTVITHKRNASTGNRNMPDPHPFVYNYGGRSYCFAHNGTLSSADLAIVDSEYARLFPLYGDEQIAEFNTTGMGEGVNTAVDSGRYFALLILHIRAVNMNVLEGLKNAFGMLITNPTPEQNCVFTDGEALYGYRHGNGYYVRYFLNPELNLAMVSTRNTNYATASAMLTGIFSDSQRIDIPNKTLLVISSQGELSSHTITQTKDIDSLGKAVIVGHKVYPNPFNPMTTIAFTVGNAFMRSENNAFMRSALIQINIYNIKGQRVKRLFDGYLPAGNHTVTWDGGECDSGVYFYRITANSQSVYGKMLLLK
jgi:predicted glutamine amidotransferase